MAPRKVNVEAVVKEYGLVTLLQEYGKYSSYIENKQSELDTLKKRVSVLEDDIEEAESIREFTSKKIAVFVASYKG